MACCGQSRMGHFADYVPVSSAQVMKVTGQVQGNQAAMTPAFIQGGPRQYMNVTGAVQSAPNASAGMHTQYAGARRVSGLGDYFNFSPLPGDWIQGIPNGFIVVGGIAIILALVMKG